MANGDEFESTKSKKVTDAKDKEKHIPLAELMRPKVSWLIN